MSYHRWYRCSALVLGLSLLCPKAAEAGVISLGTADPGAADASVWHGSKVNRNDGGNTQLMVSQGGTQLGFNTAKTYLRFNLAPLQGQSIADARLVLWSTNGNSISYPLLLYALDDLDHQWAEGSGTGTVNDTTGISWRNSPGTAETFNTFTDSTFLGGFSAMTGERTEAALGGGTTTLLDIIRSAAVTEHGTLTLMLSSALPNSTLFYRMPSAESTSFDKAPTLLVTTATPEPSTWALLAPVALLLAWRLWRKTPSLDYS